MKDTMHIFHTARRVVISNRDDDTRITVFGDDNTRLSAVFLPNDLTIRRDAGPNEQDTVLRFLSGNEWHTTLYFIDRSGVPVSVVDKREPVLEVPA